jgi:hypothetical protein
MLINLDEAGHEAWRDVHDGKVILPAESEKDTIPSSAQRSEKRALLLGLFLPMANCRLQQSSPGRPDGSPITQRALFPQNSLITATLTSCSCKSGKKESDCLPMDWLWRFLTDAGAIRQITSWISARLKGHIPCSLQCIHPTSFRHWIWEVFSCRNPRRPEFDLEAISTLS